MRVLRFIIQHITPYRWYLAGISLCICMIALCNSVKPLIVKKIIDTASGHGHASIWILCAIYGLIEFLMACTWSLNNFCTIRYTTLFRCDIAQYFMEKLYCYSYHFFQEHLVGSITSKIIDAFQLTTILVLMIILQFGQYAVLILTSLTLLFWLHPILAFIMLSWVLVLLTITFLSMNTILKLVREFSESKSKIFGLTTDYLNNILSVKAFATKDFELSQLNQLKEEFVQSSFRHGFYLRRFYNIQEAISASYALSFILFLLYGHRAGWVSPGDFAFVVMLNISIFGALDNLSHTWREFIVNWGSVDQALAIIEDLPEVQDQPHAKEINISQGAVVFDRVTFHHKNMEALFENLSLTIESGQKVGLVGHSGGGKSTFVSLILRLYDVLSGQIIIDGWNIRDVTQDSLRRGIGMIPQDPALFHRSILENIRYGRIHATDEEVMAASERACAHEFIMKLPQGYDTLVGERGVKLSGGQRQRVAIARAFLKNAPILMLDEATSQLDSVTESSIQTSLLELMEGKTTIVIAHRLSTILHMDRILVFEKGRIAEDGTHQNLLERKGVYKNLWDAQVGGFLVDDSMSQ